MPVDFQFTNSTFGTVIALPDPIDGPETWKPGETLFVYDKIVGAHESLWVTKNETIAQNGIGLPSVDWRFDVVDRTDDVIIYTKKVGGTMQTPPARVYSWPDFFVNQSIPYPYTPTFHDATILPWVAGPNPGDVGLFFNGTDYVSIPNSPELAPATGIQVDTWVQWAINPGIGNHWANIVTKGDDDDNMQYALQHSSDNSQFEFAVRNSGVGREVATSTVAGGLQNGKWYHVVASYSAATGNIQLSVDGAPPAVRYLGGNLASGIYDLHIGEGLNSDRYFNGIISNVNISPIT